MGTRDSHRTLLLWRLADKAGAAGSSGEAPYSDGERPERPCGLVEMISSAV